jgi:sulfur relay protein TusB/DsrH
MLHIIQNNPNNWPAHFSFFQQFRIFAQRGDHIILIEDAVQGHTHECFACFSKQQLNALQDDVEARGLNELEHQFNIINYDKFVELVVLNDKSMTW